MSIFHLSCNIIFIVCANGQQAVGACVNGQCGTGFTCTNGLCCYATSLTYRCLDGSDAVGFCINCLCGGNYYCTTGNLCCPLFTTGKVSASEMARMMCRICVPFNSPQPLSQIFPWDEDSFTKIRKTSFLCSYFS